ncbi:glucokinase [Falsirhodobacter sp. alg1]|uniref:glucokinase n=1 Tax=Falsirhodobacter sp. alg1 TaxID=1472418 RepID=UPI0005ED4D88|nr:glucokinase [Falsirhodobacter sp. alg1]
MSDLFLVADVGGTNTRVALADGLNIDPESVRRYSNAEHPSLTVILDRYLQEVKTKVRGACLAVAGPVANGVARLTNLDWVIDPDMLRTATGAGSVAVLNDLQAQGWALGHITKLRPLVQGEEAPADASRLVVGIGTGFNAAPVHMVNGGRIVPAAESGHVTLPMRSEEDLQLGNYLSQTHGFPGVEEALSGRGLAAIHGFVAGAPRPSSEIIPLIGSDPEATRTARIFCRLLGNVVGDLALHNLPFGGIALCGGMARAMGPHLVELGFVDAMHDKGRFSALVQSISVQVIENDYAALIGCANSLR